MPRHLIDDAHERSNGILAVLEKLQFVEFLTKGSGLGLTAGQVGPIEF